MPNKQTNKQLIKLPERQPILNIVTSSNRNTLLFIKNEGCDVCKTFYGYVETNFEKLIAPKLSENTNFYLVTINDFKNPNMWLFHVLENYSFPTVVYLEEDNTVKGIFKGGDLYDFDRFISNLYTSKVIDHQHHTSKHQCIKAKNTNVTELYST